VGATERSAWSNAAYQNLSVLGYDGKFHPVSRKGGSVYGRTAATSASSIGEPVDLALVMLPADSIEEALVDLKQARVKNAVILSSGFAEAGEDGQKRQRQLKTAAESMGIRILGPNCLGFVNFVDRSAAWTVSLREPLPAGTVAVASQSGALAMQLSFLTQTHGIGLSRIVSTGNEADIDISEVLEFLVEDEHTRSIAVFAETVRNPKRFAAAAALALSRSKPIVMLKIGSSEVAARAAQAHTGSLVGDDRVFDAVCQRYGVMRVRSLEELAFTAAFAAQAGPLGSGGLVAVSLSGGTCEIAAERAHEEGLEIANFTDQTIAALRGVLPGYATPANPLDVTGAAVLQPEVFGNTLEVVTQDANAGALLVVSDVPNAKANESPINVAVLSQIGRALASSRMPSIVCSNYMMQVTSRSRELIEKTGVNYLSCGLHHAMSAAGSVRKWSDCLARAKKLPLRATGLPPEKMPERPTSELDALKWLSSHGVPSIPMRLARSVDEAVKLADEIGTPVVLKISSESILHKTEVGGVTLNLQGKSAIVDAWHRMEASLRKLRPDAVLDGMIVAPMREEGVEVYVGTLRDPHWGPVIAVGLGGVFLEALRDTSLRMLPVTLADVSDMLSELRGTKLLDGWRGAPPVDRDLLAEIVVRVGDAAISLGTDLESLEINPLKANGSLIEAVDALFVWDTTGKALHQDLEQPSPKVREA
jgi:acyl-CoA synthetase (NDP forming)